ncbi:unnamed protein product, partial [Effrenium voratum]
PAEGCLRSARVKAGSQAEELLAFPAENVDRAANPRIRFRRAGRREKNWNLIQGQRNRLFLEYFVEPHVVPGVSGAAGALARSPRARGWGR